MPFGWTINLYFAKHIAKSVLICFATLLILIVLVDYIEIVHRTYSRNGFNAWSIFLFAAFRMPTTADIALPLATLFGSLFAYTVANRRLELVIARAAGLSAWQFLLPGAVIGLLIGTVSTTVYSPIAAALQNESLQIWATTMNGAPRGLRPTGPVWIRQDGRNGQSILAAEEVADEGLVLLGVGVYLLDEEGRFRAWISAGSTELVGDEWVMSDATITASGEAPQPADGYRLHTNLLPDQIREAFARADTIGFWDLPRLIEIADRADLPSERFRMQYHELLARPMLLVAMILLAGVVSLRLSRLGSTGPLILAGITAGFALYVVGEIAWDLGSSGIISPVVAAWTPAVLATLTSATMLLRQEDG